MHCTSLKQDLRIAAWPGAAFAKGDTDFVSQKNKPH